MEKSFWNGTEGTKETCVCVDSYMGTAAELRVAACLATALKYSSRSEKAPPRDDSEAVYLLCGLLCIDQHPYKIPPSAVSPPLLAPGDVASAVTTLPLYWDKAAVVMCSGIMCSLRLTNGWLSCIPVCC